MWDDLSMREKAAFMKVALKNDIIRLEEIKDRYNKFEEGGDLRNKQIQDINDWALNNPNRVFGDDFREQRQYLTEDTWNTLYPQLDLKIGDSNWNKIPSYLQDRLNRESINRAQNKAGEFIYNTAKGASSIMLPSSGPIIAGAEVLASQMIPNTSKDIKRDALINAGLEVLPYGISKIVPPINNKLKIISNRSTEDNIEALKNWYNRYSGPRVRASKIGFKGPYKGDWLELRKERLKSGGFDKLGITDDFTYNLPETFLYSKNNIKGTKNYIDPYPLIGKEFNGKVNARKFILDSNPIFDRSDQNTWNNAYFRPLDMGYRSPTKGDFYNFDIRFKNAATAHEFGHMVDEISKYGKSTNGIINKIPNDFSNPIPGYNSSKLPKYIQDYFQYKRKDRNNVIDITELQQRLGQLKDYFGISDSNIDITTDMWNYARRHYVNDVKHNNAMQQMFRAVKDPQSFLDYMNPLTFKYGGKLK